MRPRVSILVVERAELGTCAVAAIERDPNPQATADRCTARVTSWQSLPEAIAECAKRALDLIRGRADYARGRADYHAAMAAMAITVEDEPSDAPRGAN